MLSKIIVAQTRLNFPLKNYLSTGHKQQLECSGEQSKAGGNSRGFLPESGEPQWLPSDSPAFDPGCAVHPDSEDGSLRLQSLETEEPVDPK